MMRTLRGKIDGMEPGKRRDMAEVAYKHLLYETLEFDLDELMSTMSPKSETRILGGLFASEDELVVGSYDAIRQQYADIMASPGGFPPFEVDIAHFLVDDDGVYFDGELRQLWPGALLQSFGRDVDDPDAHYVETVWAGYMLPFVDGLMAGEIISYGPSKLVKATG